MLVYRDLQRNYIISLKKLPVQSFSRPTDSSDAHWIDYGPWRNIPQFVEFIFTLAEISLVLVIMVHTNVSFFRLGKIDWELKSADLLPHELLSEKQTIAYPANRRFGAFLRQSICRFHSPPSQHVLAHLFPGNIILNKKVEQKIIIIIILNADLMGLFKRVMSGRKECTGF